MLGPNSWKIDIRSVDSPMVRQLPLLMRDNEDSAMGYHPTAWVVENDEHLAGHMTSVLRAIGCEGCTARNGLHGDATDFRHPTALVVANIQMPELDGFEIVHCLRASNPALTALYVSGAVDELSAILESEKTDVWRLCAEQAFLDRRLDSGCQMLVG